MDDEDIVEDMVSDFGPEEASGSDPSFTHIVSVKDVAKEVIAGYWGRGQNRNNKLQAAGYDIDAINAEITKIFNR